MKSLILIKLPIWLFFYYHYFSTAYRRTLHFYCAALTCGQLISTCYFSHFTLIYSFQFLDTYWYVKQLKVLSSNYYSYAYHNLHFLLLLWGKRNNFVNIYIRTCSAKFMGQFKSYKCCTFIAVFINKYELCSKSCSSFNINM